MNDDTTKFVGGAGAVLATLYVLRRLARRHRAREFLRAQDLFERELKRLQKRAGNDPEALKREIVKHVAATQPSTVQTWRKMAFKLGLPDPTENARKHGVVPDEIIRVLEEEWAQEERENKEWVQSLPPDERRKLEREWQEIAQEMGFDAKDGLKGLGRRRVRHRRRAGRRR